MFLSAWVWTAPGLAEPPVETHAPWVTCFDHNGVFVSGDEVSTPPLASRTGKGIAFARINADVGGSAGCGNTVHLLVADPGKPFAEVFHEGPTDDGGNANSLGPVAWSPDERWLAVEFGYGFYASDNFSRALLLYDAKSGQVTQPDVIGLVQSRMRKGCSLQLLSIAGFDSEDRVRLRVADSYSEEGRDSSCVDGSAEWLYDPSSGLSERAATR